MNRGKTDEIKKKLCYIISRRQLAEGREDMAVRLIALDLDGTALKHHRDFSERNAKAVSAALKAGILVVPATGRSYIDIPKGIRELPGIPYFVTSNGANIVDGRTGESSFHDLISCA